MRHRLAAQVVLVRFKQTDFLLQTGDCLLLLGRALRLRLVMLKLLLFNHKSTSQLVLQPRLLELLLQVVVLFHLLVVLVYLVVPLLQRDVHVLLVSLVFENASLEVLVLLLRHSDINFGR